jgi:hypothetical protein
MKIQTLPSEKRRPANTLNENPRFFDVNADTRGRSEETLTEQDFKARWWPGEMRQHAPPPKG